jgi:hypothetical protein
MTKIFLKSKKGKEINKTKKKNTKDTPSSPGLSYHERK